MPLRQALMVQQWLKTDSCPKVFFKKAVLESVVIFKEEHYSEHFQTLPFGKCNNVYCKTSTVELVFLLKLFLVNLFWKVSLFSRKNTKVDRVSRRGTLLKRGLGLNYSCFPVIFWKFS